MRDIVKAAITKNMSRPAKSVKAKTMPPRKGLDTITPTDEIESAAAPVESVTALRNGLKRKQPSVAAATSRSDVVETLDMTGDDDDDDDDDAWVLLTNSAKRRRLHAVSDVATLSTPRRNSVATPLASREKDASSKPSAVAQSSPAAYGLLSPDSTPQKPQDKFKALHFADTAYASTSTVDDTTITGDSLVTESTVQAQTLASDGPTQAAARDRSATREPADVDMLNTADTATRSCSASNNAQNTGLSQSTAWQQPLASNQPRNASPEPRQTPKSPRPRVRPQDDDDDTGSEASYRPPTPEAPIVPLSDRKLHDIPEPIADRYLPKISPDGVVMRDPGKFSTVKPTYWKRWTPNQYLQFLEYHRETFDPVPLAKEMGMPVEEVQCLHNALVCNPLYDAGEAAKRGEKGVLDVMNLSVTTPPRFWGAKSKKDGPPRVKGELTGVEKGVVKLIMRTGHVYTMQISDLVREDVKYLLSNLREKDKRVLWEGHAIGTPYSMSTRLRTWTRKSDTKKAVGELAEVSKKGSLVLMLEQPKEKVMVDGKEAMRETRPLKEGRRIEVEVDQFVEEDVEYLQDALKEKDKVVLWPGEAMEIT
ncbi:hypothetical protein LTS10_001096 [Elasticomyces elasticus]|nr:hypothetical protein LTS10_001096 [Elasticomyces elasticus]